MSESAAELYYESGCTYTMTVCLITWRGFSSMCYTASPGRSRCDGVRWIVEADDRQADSGSVASSSKIKLGNIGDEVDELGGIKTKAVPTTTMMRSKEDGRCKEAARGIVCEDINPRHEVDKATIYDSSTARMATLYLLAEVL